MRVLISGAGIAGPTLAWFLAQAGHKVTVLEKSQAFLAQGQNIDVHGSAITVLKKMGLMDEIKRFNTTECGTRLIDPKGRPFAPFHVDGISATSPFEILRGDLAVVLYEASKKVPNVEYRFGITVSKVVENGETAVKVELSNGETQEFDLLVAADGQWSRIRKWSFPSESVNVVDSDMYAVYFTIPRLPEDNEWWNVYSALRSRIITTRPDPHGTIRAMFSLMPCNDAQKKAWQEVSRSDRQTQEDFIRKEFADAGWQAPRILDAMPSSPDFYLQAIQQIRMTRWSTGRIICLGDAAYCPTPLTGNGTPLAIIGAYLLAGELTKLGKGEHPAQAFEAYERVFRPFVEEIQNAWIQPKFAHPASAWKRWLLQTFIALFYRIVTIPWVEKRWKGDRDEELNHDGFPLPPYPLLDEKVANAEK